MKKGKAYQKIVSLIMIVVLGVLMWPETAHAMYIDYVGSKCTVAYSAKDRRSGCICEDLYIGDNVKKLKVKSSRPSVVKVKLVGKYGAFKFYPQKTGTAKITLSGVLNGKKITRKKTIKVVKYAQPFKSLKIGGKSYLKKVKASTNTIAVKTKKNVKLTYKLNKGWQAYNAMDECERMGIKKSYDLKPYPRSLVVRNKKTGVQIEIVFYSY